MKEKRSGTKTRIIEYIRNHHTTSKAELSRVLNLSMPTILTNVNELMEQGILTEVGAYESTGGRKARQIGLNKDYCYALGMNLTQNHVGLVLLNAYSEIIKSDRVRLKFSTELSYCRELAEALEAFTSDITCREKIVGLGISVPGIVDFRDDRIVKSHVLNLENYSLHFLRQTLPYPLHFENDANAAMLAEDLQNYKNAIYLSLNRTLGGAFCINGELYRGENQKAGEFGHMILFPGGRTCYCGKKGCADAYCSAQALMQESDEGLETFMQQLQDGNPAYEQKWQTYLDHLAILVSNLRMAYDMDVILGGDVGGYLQEDQMILGEKVMQYNGFDRDISYLKSCTYKTEASAVGAARYFLVGLC